MGCYNARMSQNKPRRVHIEIVTKTHKGTLYRSVLLRRTFREDGKVKHETLGNLSDLPEDLIQVMRQRLADGRPLAGNGGAVQILRSLPHGNVAAVLGTARKIGLDRLLCSTRCRERDLVLAMIVDRVISPGSKLSGSVGLNEQTAQNTLAEELQLGDVDVHDLYGAMDWLLARQKRIENKLVKKHLSDGTLVLFDVSSSYYTGKKSSLIQHGYSRDHRRDRPQIVYGLLCDRDGRPIAVEVFAGNTADPTAFTDLVQRIRKRFGIERVVFVGDRGMITTARINEDLRGRSGVGRSVRDPHQRVGRDHDAGRNSRRVQESFAGRACVPEPEDGRPAVASDLPSQRRPHPRTRVSLHAGILRGMAHASAAARGAFRGDRPRVGGIGTPFDRGPVGPFQLSAAKRRDADNRIGASRPKLSGSASRPGHALPLPPPSEIERCGIPPAERIKFDATSRSGVVGSRRLSRFRRALHTSQ